MVDHIKANLWLPTGGHVEADEDPADTVRRELAEELGLEAARTTQVAATPLFVTSTSTRGALSHVDVSLWYVVAADWSTPLNPDLREFRSVRWYGFDEVETMAAGRLDPHMHRFVHKLAVSLER
jgi:8-oxo-dGTP pyrophosphatase MutT (NUDIX family)